MRGRTVSCACIFVWNLVIFKLAKIERLEWWKKIVRIEKRSVQRSAHLYTNKIDKQSTFTNRGVNTISWAAAHKRHQSTVQEEKQAWHNKHPNSRNRTKWIAPADNKKQWMPPCREAEVGSAEQSGSGRRTLVEKPDVGKKNGGKKWGEGEQGRKRGAMNVRPRACKGSAVVQVSKKKSGS